FASIGTNDLTQYTMAADRLLGSLAELSDPWQPAVLQLVAATCRGGDLQGRPVGVCGEAASNPVLAAVLVGLGVSSLSMTARAIPDVAALLGAVTIAECRAVAQLALAAESAADARAAVRAALPQLDELGL
ncbi:MAG: ptsP, partial [Oerskovia sp.]|nr:ptsP [Oerskovia sp.]